jgi:hypothetical protein
MVPTIDVAPLFGPADAARAAVDRAIAAADAEIRPLPADDPRSFTPFRYGDYLWERITTFVEFRGMERQRPAELPPR